MGRRATKKGPATFSIFRLSTSGPILKLRLRFICCHSAEAVVRKTRIVHVAKQNALTVVSREELEAIVEELAATDGKNDGRYNGPIA